MLVAFTPAKGAQARLSGSQACLLLKKRMGTHYGVPPTALNKTWFCDITQDDDNSHPHWWVIGLRSFRQCDGICSNLVGWFSVNRITGEVREWDVANYAVGAPIGKP